LYEDVNNPDRDTFINSGQDKFLMHYKRFKEELLGDNSERLYSFYEINFGGWADKFRYANISTARD